MKIRADRKALAEAASWAAQAIAKSPAMPALAGLRLTAAGSGLVLEAFDYDRTHRVTIEADVVTDGHCLVSAHFLVQIVSAMKGGVVELVLDGERLTVTCGSSTYARQVLRLDDYPTLPERPTPVGTTSADALISAVIAARPMADVADSAPVLGCIHLTSDADTLSVVGLRRQGVVQAQVHWTGDALIANVPVKVLEPAVRGLVGDVEIGFDDGVIGVSDAHRAVTMRTIVEPFPKYASLMRSPDADLFESVVDVEDLIEAVKRAGTLADDTTPIMLTFAGGLVGVEVAADERGAGTEVVTATNTGEAQLAIHPPFLLAALAAMPTAPIRIGVGTLPETDKPMQPLTIRPLEHDHRVALVMLKRLPKEIR